MKRRCFLGVLMSVPVIPAAVMAAESKTDGITFDGGQASGDDVLSFNNGRLHLATAEIGSIEPFEIRNGQVWINPDQFVVSNS